MQIEPQFIIHPVALILGLALVVGGLVLAAVRCYQQRGDVYRNEDEDPLF